MYLYIEGKKVHTIETKRSKTKLAEIKGWDAKKLIKVPKGKKVSDVITLPEGEVYDEAGGCLVPMTVEGQKAKGLISDKDFSAIGFRRKTSEGRELRSLCQEVGDFIVGFNAGRSLTAEEKALTKSLISEAKGFLEDADPKGARAAFAAIAPGGRIMPKEMHDAILTALEKY